eukprot:TRINITY_DN8521_c0_g1_i1.p2 TRINITY_DN8521_c0_g1~~TRINITY_DN8521_c0_g1_i1.p2  ORF type:complete len:152 (+),score=18.86 TRINITY_DN8521_c0_g1_i1:169-624(+)
MPLPSVSLAQLSALTTGTNNNINNNHNNHNPNATEPQHQSSSSHRCCAERKLLGSWMEVARKKGVPAHKRVTWVRRKLGGDMAIWRITNDGNFGCAVPCIFCERMLRRFDMRVQCVTREGSWFVGRLGDEGAPSCVLTSSQRRGFEKEQLK